METKEWLRETVRARQDFVVRRSVQRVSRFQDAAEIDLFAFRTDRPFAQRLSREQILARFSQ